MSLPSLNLISSLFILHCLVSTEPASAEASDTGWSVGGKHSLCALFKIGRRLTSYLTFSRTYSHEPAETIFYFQWLLWTKFYIFDVSEKFFFKVLIVFDWFFILWNEGFQTIVYTHILEKLFNVVIDSFYPWRFNCGLKKKEPVL